MNGEHLPTSMDYKSESTESDVVMFLFFNPDWFVKYHDTISIDLFTNSACNAIVKEFHKTYPAKYSVTEAHSAGLVNENYAEAFLDGSLNSYKSVTVDMLIERVNYLTVLRSRREMYDAIYQLIGENATTRDLDALASGFMNKVNSIIRKSNLSKNKIVDTSMFVDMLQANVSTSREQLKLGWGDLDSRFKVYRNNLVTIAANTSVGKTWVGLNIYDYAVRNGKVGVFFTIEMSDTETVNRLSTMYAETWDIDNMTHDEFDKIFVAVSQAKHNIVYDPRLTPQRIRAVLIELQQKYGHVDYVVVDYLTRMEMPQTREDYRIKVGNTAKELKTIAGEFNCAVFMLAQLSRDNLKRNDKRPITTDLGESKMIDDESDSILLLYSEEYIRERVTHQPIDDSQKSILELNITKNRHGKIDFELLYMKAGGRLHQLTTEAQAEYYASLRTNK